MLEEMLCVLIVIADNENKDQTGYTTFVKALRTQFATDKSKQYYISAAPQCPLPDASIPVDAMKLMDFVVSNLCFPFPVYYPDLCRTRHITQILESELLTRGTIVGSILQQRQLQHRPIRLRRQLQVLEPKHRRGPSTVHRRPRLHGMRRLRVSGSGCRGDGHQRCYGGQRAQYGGSDAVGWIGGDDQRGRW